MSNLEKVDELIYNFIKDKPTLKNNNDLIENIVVSIDDSFDISEYKITFESSYEQFEGWLNNLLDNEKPQEDIVAFNFGLYETEVGIQLYITGSNEWENDDEDWASNNDYFPKGRYLNIALYNNLNSILEDNYEVGLFLTIASTVMYVNTFVISNSSKLLKEKEFVVLATGFDDGDLYNFSKLSNEGITTIES